MILDLNYKVIFTACCILGLVLQPAYSSDWCYDAAQCGDGAKWGGLCESGKKQSPIQIISSNAYIAKRTNLPVTFSPAWCGTSTGILIANTGNSIEVSLGEEANQTEHSFTSPGFRGVYGFYKMYFHWGSSDKEGSEHIVDGEGFDMEIQMVHQRTSAAEVAIDDPNASQSFSVFGIGVSAEEDAEPNPGIQAILDVLPQVNKRASPIPKKFKNIPLNLFSFLPEDKMVYRYIGSLTTPNCTQDVVWTVFQNSIKISKAQLNLFRDIANDKDKKLENNIRKPQELHGRQYAEQRFTVNCQPVSIKMGDFKGEVGEVEEI